MVQAAHDWAHANLRLSAISAKFQPHEMPQIVVFFEGPVFEGPGAPREGLQAPDSARPTGRSG